MRRSTSTCRAGARTAVLAAGLTLLTACGLENIPYLEPPVGGGVVGFAFSFTRTLDNSENGANYQFEGFELYYRFYRATDTPDGAIADRAGLLAAGFRRVSDGSLTDVSKPLIAVAWDDPRGVIDFTLDFAASPEPKITNDKDASEIVVRRDPPYEAGHPLAPGFKSFIYDLSPGNPSYLGTDPDAKPIEDDLAIFNSQVQLSLYALSYGRQDYVTDLYSNAVYLGTITKNFGW